MSVPASCLPHRYERSELYRILDGYLNALKVNDPALIAWAPTVVNVENNVALMVGDGLWGTISGLGDYDLRFADVAAGEIGFFGAVAETHAVSPLALRLKVVDGRISEVETIVVRAADSGIKFPDPVFENKQVLNDGVPVNRRQKRERLISIADGYFDTLQLNDGTLFTYFSDDCNRVENGVQTTNNSTLAMTPTAALSCAEQFKRGTYRYDDRVRGRRYPLVDEERGLVFAAAFIDHRGKLGSYQLTDGTPVESPVRRPHTFCMLELFKIFDGQIQQIEAVFITVPYYMPSPFDK